MKNEIQTIDQETREISILGEKQQVNLKALFTNEGIDALIEVVKKGSDGLVADISTKKGKEAMKSKAYQVACSKAPIKELAKELKADHQAAIEGINSQLERFETSCDKLRDEIKKPVIDLEKKEEADKKEKQDRLDAMENLRQSINGVIVESGEYQKLIESVKEYSVFEWGAFAFKAETLANDLISDFEQREIFAKKSEADQAELEKLRKEAIERSRKDHEAQIAKEAAEEAKLEAEKLAEIEKNRVEKEKAEAIEAAKEREAKIEADKKAAEQAKIDAENRLIEAERLAKEKAVQDEKDKVAAAKKAEEDAKIAADAAVEAERKRVMIEQIAETERKKAAEAQAAKIAANKKHRAKIEQEALSGIEKIIITHYDPDCKRPVGHLLIEAIKKGEIPNITINY